MRNTISNEMHEALGSNMRADLDETPLVLSSLLQHLISDTRVKSWRQKAARGLGFVARGSSAHMAQLAATALATNGPSLPCVLPPSTFTSPGSVRANLTDCLIFAVSQSGETPEITNAAAAARKQGAFIVGVTNTPNSPLAEAVDEMIELRAGQERAVPATKTVNAQAAAMLFLMGKLMAGTDHKSPSDEEWQLLPEFVGRLLTKAGWESAQMALGAGPTPRAVLGRGLTTPIAREGALKMTETAGALVAGDSGYEFLHGWVAGTKRGDRAITMAATSQDAKDLEHVSTELAKRSVKTIALEAETEGTPSESSWFKAIALLVRIEQIAWLNACQLGLDPDEAFGLSKVTATE